MREWKGERERERKGGWSERESGVLEGMQLCIASNHFLSSFSEMSAYPLTYCLQFPRNATLQ